MINIENLHTAMIIVTDIKGVRHPIEPKDSMDIDVNIENGHPLLTAKMIKIKQVKETKEKGKENDN